MELNYSKISLRVKILSVGPAKLLPRDEFHMWRVTGLSQAAHLKIGLITEALSARTRHDTRKV